MIPAQLLIDRFFEAEKEHVDKLQAEHDAVTQEKEQFEQEHSADGGALEGLEGSRGDITKGNVKERTQELKELALNTFDPMTPEYQRAIAITKTRFGEPEWEKGIEDPDGIFAEFDVIYEYRRLAHIESEKQSEVQKATAELYRKVIETYPELTEEEVKDLVVEGKWIATVEGAVRDEVERITQRLAGRVQELVARYADPLPELEDEVDALAETVDGHLQRTVDGSAELS